MWPRTRPLVVKAGIALTYESSRYQAPDFGELRAMSGDFDRIYFEEVRRELPRRSKLFRRGYTWSSYILPNLNRPPFDNSLFFLLLSAIDFTPPFNYLCLRYFLWRLHGTPLFILLRKYSRQSSQRLHLLSDTTPTPQSHTSRATQRRIKKPWRTNAKDHLGSSRAMLPAELTYDIGVNTQSTVSTLIFLILQSPCIFLL